MEIPTRCMAESLCTVARMASDEFLTYEIWLSPSDAPALWEALRKAGAAGVGAEALEKFRVMAGVPRYGVDIRDRDLPQETEQTGALHFSKGCYIGQEIVERIRSRGNVRRKFTGFLIDGPLPAAGTKIQSAGKDVGEITSSASLPGAAGERAVALGYLRREAAMPDKELQAGNARATVTELPFEVIND